MYYACRGLATMFERKKPHVNIGKIGRVCAVPRSVDTNGDVE